VKAQGAGVVCANPPPYRLDGEVGRFSFSTHRLECAGQVVFDSARELFAPLPTNARYLTRGFKEVALVDGCVEQSYRKTAARLNRWRYQTVGGMPWRSLQEQAEAAGQRWQAQLEQQAEQILVKHRLHLVDSAAPVVPSQGPEQVVSQAAEKVEACLRACTTDEVARAEMRANPVPYEDPQHSVKVSIDDVGVKRQKAQRPKQGDVAPTPTTPTAAAVPTKFIHTTVAEVQTEAGRYVLSGSGVVKVLRLLPAFLLQNGLTGWQLICLMDGQRSLYAHLAQVLRCSRGWQVILDWYHLEKKCAQATSLTIKGRDQRNAVLAQLSSLLGEGRVDAAIAYVKGLSPALSKAEAQRALLIGYLERARPYIPCYAVRQQLGLRNSSHRGEKQNDLVVAERQKHNGMSWSESGSAALAALATAQQNEEALSWFRTGDIRFRLVA
jgi:hypothetical protein